MAHQRKPRFRVVSEAHVHGELIGRFVAEFPTLAAAARKATKDAKTRGLVTSVQDTRDSYRHGYLMRCVPTRKRGRAYAQCRISPHARALLKVSTSTTVRSGGGVAR